MLKSHYWIVITIVSIVIQDVTAAVCFCDVDIYTEILVEILMWCIFYIFLYICDRNRFRMSGYQHFPELIWWKLQTNGIMHDRQNCLCTVNTILACFTKQYNLVLVIRRWSPVAVGLASHWPCITDLKLFIHLWAHSPRKGQWWAPCLHSSCGGTLYLTLTFCY